MQIYSSLTLRPTKVILPYDPNIVKTQAIQFTANGGDGSYTWHSQNRHLLQINPSGLATTIITDWSQNEKRYHGISDTHHSLEGGSLMQAHSSIRVALAKNQKITRQADIYFLPPVKLEILKYNFETSLGDYVHLHVALYAMANGTYTPFTLCDNLEFNFEFSNQIFQSDNNNKDLADMVPVDGACHIIHLRSTAEGFTSLTVSYKFQREKLKDEVTLHVFKPLSTLHPQENVIILPIGASRNIIYAFGPQRIYNMETDLQKSSNYNAQVVEIKPIETTHAYHVYNILCTKLGETQLDLSLYHTLQTTQFQPYVFQIITKIYCVKPRFLNLYATEELRASCPMELKNSLLHLKEKEDKFKIEIEVLDSQNRKLMNISSLHIEWEFLGSTEDNLQQVVATHQRMTEDINYEGICLPGKNILLTSLSEMAHNFRIKGLVAKYDGSVLRKYGIKAEHPNFGIKNVRIFL